MEQDYEIKVSWRRWPILISYGIFSMNTSFNVSLMIEPGSTLTTGFISTLTSSVILGSRIDNLNDLITPIFKWMMFQSITSLTSHYYNVSEDQVTWLAQVSMVSMCVTLIPTTLLSEARRFIDPFDKKTKI